MTLRGDAPADRRITVYAGLEELSDATARAVAQAARESVATRGSFSLVLSGGETPRRTYELLANRYAADIAWDRTDVFFSDERFVPPDDPRNNFAMTNEALLSRVAVPAKHVHAIPTVGGAPDAMASRYEATLRAHVVSAALPGAPAFDFALLGVGADGHTASLFPGDAALREDDRWAIAVAAPDGAPVRERITLTLPLLNRARRVVFLVAGEGKRNAVARILRRTPEQGKEPLPAARVHGLFGTDWLLDARAAADLEP